MPESDRRVLVTGASSGIGLATASRLLDAGWTVVAAARRIDAMAGLQRRGALVLPLDLTDDESRRALADRIHGQIGALDGLVNNAGFGDVGPVETMALERARALFDVNLFGLVGLTQLLLPAMRERRRGRLVNVSSIAGRFVTPGAGWYGASKHALEGISDALRLELSGFGVDVVVVEPGLIRTGFDQVTAAAMAEEVRRPVWGPMMRAVAGAWETGFRQGSDPDVVARTIVRALTVRRPRPRYRCGRDSEALLAHALLPTELWDAVVRWRMTRPRG